MYRVKCDNVSKWIQRCRKISLKMSENGPKIVRKCVEKCQKGPKMPDNLSKIKSPKILVNGSQNVRNWVNEC